MDKHALAESAYLWGSRFRRFGELGRAFIYKRGNVTIGRGVRVHPGVTLRAAPGSRIVVGPRTEIDKGATLVALEGGELILGPGVRIGMGCVIAAYKRVEIAENTGLAEYCSLRDHDHDPEYSLAEGPMIPGEIILGPDCWIAAKVTILRNVTIGANTVVGANAVVTKSLPSGVLVGGVPAKVIRTLDRKRLAPEASEPSGI